MGSFQINDALRDVWRHEILGWLEGLEAVHGSIVFRQSVESIIYDVFTDGSLAIYDDPDKARQVPSRKHYPSEKKGEPPAG